MWAANVAPEARPSDDDVCDACEVGFALIDCARELGRERIAIWDVSVPIESAQLAADVGVSVERVERAVRVLAESAVVAGYTLGGSVVRVQRDALTLGGDIARLDAAAVRRRVPAGQGVRAVRVLRAIALAPEDVRRPGWRRVPNSQIAAATGLGVDRVEYVVKRLRGAGLLEADGMPRSAAWYRLTPLAFGEDVVDATDGERRSDGVRVLAMPTERMRERAGGEGEGATIGRGTVDRGPVRSAVAGATESVSFTAFGVPLELPRDVMVELEGDVGGVASKLRIRFPTGGG